MSGRPSTCGRSLAQVSLRPLLLTGPPAAGAVATDVLLWEAGRPELTATVAGLWAGAARTGG